MIKKIYDAGDTIEIEAEIKNNEAFESPVLADPDNGVTITITDPTDIVVVSGQSMSKKATGQYYYKWQSATDSELGDYTVIIVADSAGYDGRLNIEAFTLE